MSQFIRHLRTVLLGLGVILGTPTFSGAITITVDFEGPNTSGTSVTGSALDTYMGGFGITISNVSPSGYPEIHDPNVGFPAGFLVPSSGVNYLSHGDGIAGGGANASTNAPISYQLNFSTSLDSVSFTRIQINAFTSPSGSITASWSARALDGLGNTLSTVGEPQFASFGIIPAATFTLIGPSISALVIERTTTNFMAGVNTAFIDDLQLNTSTAPVPEPSTMLLLGSGLAGLAMWRRKRQS